MGKRYEFGEFILDTQEGLLSRSNEPLKATPRLLALLEALVDRRGRLVEKKELLDRVWEGTSVGEANLTVQMSKLRRLLGETEECPFIETVPTRGYRFLIPVRVLPPAATEALPLRRPPAGPEASPAEALPVHDPPAAIALPARDTPAADGRRFRWSPWGLAAALLVLVIWVASGGSVRHPIGGPGPVPDAAAAVGTKVATTPDGTLRLTSDAADDWEPAVSPDGRTVAFVSNRDGAPAIYLLALDRRDVPPVRLPTRGPAGAPAWSPDGARLAFVCQRNGQADICLVGRDGTGERLVAGEPQDEVDPVWSPDGRRLAYTLANGRTWELRVVDSDGGRPRMVGPAGWSSRTPAWSPGGDRLAVSRWRSAEHYDIWTVPLDGSAPAPMVQGDASTFDPAWSPDGRRLACATGHGLVVVDVATRTAVDVASTTGTDRRPVWSRDGQSLVIESGRDGNAEIYQVPVR